MEPVFFEADKDLLDRLTRHARDQGVSVNEVIRRAVEREVGADQRPKLRFIGSIDSGEADLASRVEELYEPPPMY